MVPGHSIDVFIQVRCASGDKLVEETLNAISTGPGLGSICVRHHRRTVCVPLALPFVILAVLAPN